ncbi:unnamed protein product [Closterium sp. NIES-54]
MTDFTRASHLPSTDACRSARRRSAHQVTLACHDSRSRRAAARLAVRSHLPSTERAHFSQYKSAKTLYDAVVARYSSLATAALSRLMLSYLFPDLAAFATVTDLITTSALVTPATALRFLLSYAPRTPPPCTSPSTT